MQENVENWGQEYLRNIAGEIGEEYHLALQKDKTPPQELLDLVAQIVPYHMAHNSGAYFTQKCACRKKGLEGRATM